MSRRETLGYSPYCSGNSEYPPDEPSVGPVDSDEVYCWMNRDLLGDQKCDELGESDSYVMRPRPERHK